MQHVMIFYLFISMKTLSDRVTVLWAEALHKHNLRLLCWEVHFKHCIIRAPLTWRFLVYKVSLWETAPAQLHCFFFWVNAPGSEPRSEPQFQRGYQVWAPHNLVQKDLHPPPLTANKTSSYRAVCDLAQWRSGAAQDRTLEICISVFSIAVHFPVVLGRPLNFPHSYPLVQE